MHAANTSLIYSPENIYEYVERLNIEVTKINRWSVANQRCINESKTKLMVFYWNIKIVPTVLQPIRINNASIKRVYSFKFLGTLLKIYQNSFTEIECRWCNFNLTLFTIFWFIVSLSRALRIQMSQNHWKFHRISSLEQFVVPIERIELHHHLFHWQTLMLNMYITIWFVLILQIYFKEWENFCTPRNSMQKWASSKPSSTQTVQYITYSGPRIIVPVNIRRCISFVTFKCRLKAHT